MPAPRPDQKRKNRATLQVRSVAKSAPEPATIAAVVGTLSAYRAAHPGRTIGVHCSCVSGPAAIHLCSAASPP